MKTKRDCERQTLKAGKGGSVILPAATSTAAPDTSKGAKVDKTQKGKADGIA